MRAFSTRGYVALALLALLLVGAGVVLAQMPPMEPGPLPPVAPAPMRPGPMMGMANVGTAMAIDGGFVYIVQGPTLYKIDANTLEVVASLAFARPGPGPGPVGGLLGAG